MYALRSADLGDVRWLDFCGDDPSAARYERRQVRRDPREGRGILTGARIRHRVPLLLTLAVGLALVPAAQARHWPRPPSWWTPGAFCIHRGESTDYHIHNEPYANGWQFTLGTWMRAGGAREAWITASPAEQLYRVWIIWKRDGGSFREWPNTSRACGLR